MNDASLPNISWLTTTALIITFTTAKREQELAEKKKREYEEWLRAQEMEAYRLEYDCSVKYEEHKQDKEEEVMQKSTQLTTNFSKTSLDR